MQLHVTFFVSSLLFFYLREESFPYSIVIAVWHVVPHFTIPEMSFCVGSGSLTTLTWGPAATRSPKCNDLSCLPTLGWLSAALRIAHATSQIFREYHYWQEKGGD